MVTSWSYSHYSLALQCLAKYKYVVVDKIKTPENSSDLAFGTALHTAINDILIGHEGEDVFTILWNSHEGSALEYGRFNHGQLKELGLNFISKFRRLHAKKYILTFAEQRLHSEYKGIKLEGTPDFIGQYNGRFSLRDFKTSGYQYDKERGTTALQLYLYAYLALKNGIVPKIDTLGYDVFNKGVGSIQTLTWEFSEEKMYLMLDDMVEYVGKIANSGIAGAFPRNPNSCFAYNRKCEMFDKCWEKKND